MWQQVDLLILPVSLLPPFQNDLDFKEPANGPTLVNAQKPLCVLNILGLPGLSLPTHVKDGTPLGVQLVGPMHDEDALLAAGLLLEEELGQVLDQMPLPYRL
jgi:amidase